MKTTIEASYIRRVGDHKYELIYEIVDNNLIFGGDINDRFIRGN